MRQKATWKIMGIDKFLTGSKEDFDAWIRDTIGGNFRRKVRPLDLLSNRKIVANLILVDIERNGGVFPGSNVFIERVRSKRRDGQDE
jgi:hypothetical protein